jgi:hypothetical protein
MEEASNSKNMMLLLGQDTQDLKLAVRALTVRNTNSVLTLLDCLWNMILSVLLLNVYNFYNVKVLVGDVCAKLDKIQAGQPTTPSFSSPTSRSSLTSSSSGEPSVSALPEIPASVWKQIKQCLRKHLLRTPLLQGSGQNKRKVDGGGGEVVCFSHYQPRLAFSDVFFEASARSSSGIVAATVASLYMEKTGVMYMSCIHSKLMNHK